MQKSKLLVGALFASMLTLGTAAGVYAQQAPGGPPAMGAPQGPPGPGMGMGRGMRGGGQQMDPAAMQKLREERQAKRAQLMHDALGITANQESAWKAFQDAMKPPAFTPPTADRRAQLEAMTTPQRLDERLARQTEMYNVVKARTEATKRFYNQLTPTQKKSFDALAQMGGRGDGPGMRGGRGDRGGMGGGMRGPGGPGGGGRGGPGGPMGGPPPT
jgi:Spy/CpxP family protein refolding chaperone